MYDWVNNLAHLKVLFQTFMLNYFYNKVCNNYLSNYLYLEDGFLSLIVEKAILTQ